MISPDQQWPLINKQKTQLNKKSDALIFMPSPEISKSRT
jgi:hypothetical protein